MTNDQRQMGTGISPTADLQGAAETTYRGALDMQVCVPSDWDDAAVKNFADRTNICGTENGWAIRKEGDKALRGCPERIPCNSRAGFVHIMLDA